jgi:hypothetical protein
VVTTLGISDGRPKEPRRLRELAAWYREFLNPIRDGRCCGAAPQRLQNQQPAGSDCLRVPDNTSCSIRAPCACSAITTTFPPSRFGTVRDETIAQRTAASFDTGRSLLVQFLAPGRSPVANASSGAVRPITDRYRVSQSPRARAQWTEKGCPHAHTCRSALFASGPGQASQLTARLESSSNAGHQMSARKDQNCQIVQARLAMRTYVSWVSERHAVPSENHVNQHSRSSVMQEEDWSLPGAVDLLDDWIDEADRFYTAAPAASLGFTVLGCFGKTSLNSSRHKRADERARASPTSTPRSHRNHSSVVATSCAAMAVLVILIVHLL